MKNLIKIITLAFLVAGFYSCSENKSEGELAELINTRDSLKIEHEKIGKELNKVEQKIMKLDTTHTNALVTTITLSPIMFKHYFEVYGNVESKYNAQIFPETQGNVIEILVNEGEKVSKGQTLVRLDAGLINKNIAQLQTEQDLANTLFERQKRLWEQNIGSEVQYLQAKNRKEALEANLATLQQQASQNVIRAPFAGIVEKIFPKIGEMAGPQFPVARVLNLNDVYITADVSERYLNRVQEGDSVEVIVSNSDTVTSTISRVGNYINPANRTFEIQVDVSKVKDQLRPNSLTTLKINDFTGDSALVIPSSLIMQDGTGASYVYVIENGDGEIIAEKRIISTGLSYNGKTLISSGLKPGEKIIDRGARSVQNGEAVEEMQKI